MADRSACTEQPKDVPVAVTAWTEPVPVTRFHGDPRGHLASVCPRAWPIGDLEGVPASVRANLGKNIRHLTFPYSYSVDSDGGLESRDVKFCSIVSPEWSVVMCPGMGGRVMSIYHHGLEAELLWNQPVGWRSVFGLAGAWSIGGVEHNANRLGHQVHGLSGVKTEQLKLADGRTAVRFGAFDELFGSEWSVTISLLPDRVRTRIRFANHSSKPIPGYWWTNIAVPGSPRIRVMLEPGPVLHHGHYAGFHSRQWPYLNENDWSEWRNHDDITSGYAYEIRDGRMGYIDRERGIAFVHYADPSACLGRKLWTIGAFYDKVAWWDRLSEPGICSYYEMQCGRRPTQVEADLLAPGQVVEWDEDYSAVPAGAPAEDYTQQWEQYAKQTQFVVAKNGSCKDSAVEDAILLHQADERLQLSEQVTIRPTTLGAEDVSAAASRYWLAGEQWIKALAGHLEASMNVRLKYAAALIAEGQVADARRELEVIRAKANGETLGWAHVLLGMLDRTQADSGSAANCFARAIQAWPELIEGRLDLHETLIALNRTSELASLWKAAPGTDRLKDVVTLAQAETAFLMRDWATVRTLLGRPFRGTSEGDSRFWLLRRETDIAEGLELYGSGQAPMAAILLASAAQSMPNYGTGRGEAHGNTDLMFYRWFLAMASGNAWQRRAILNAVLMQRPMAQSPGVAYSLRIAQGENHPSSDRLRRLAGHVDRGAGRVPDLRAAALGAADGDYTGFASLRSDRLYRYRADFECAVVAAHQKRACLASMESNESVCP